MLSIHRTGASIADVIASVRGVPSRMIPYAAATALTRCAKQAQTEDLPAEMRKVFANPVPYTLNALRIEPATKDNLVARVMVKTGAHAPGVAPENFLFPEVEGGVRKHKGLEMALRYQGVLSPTQYAMPGAAAKLDAYGNVSGAQVRTILNALKGTHAKQTQEASDAFTQARPARDAAVRADLDRVERLRLAAERSAATARAQAQANATAGRDLADRYGALAQHVASGAGVVAGLRADLARRDDEVVLLRSQIDVDRGLLRH